MNPCEHAQNVTEHAADCNLAMATVGRAACEICQRHWEDGQAPPSLPQALAEIIPVGKPRGLGDTIAKVLTGVGIAPVVKAISKALGRPCGCSGRQSRLNQLISYGKGK